MRHHLQGVELEQIPAGHLWLSWVRISGIKQATETVALESQPCHYLHLSVKGQMESVTGMGGQVCCSMAR